MKRETLPCVFCGCGIPSHIARTLIIEGVEPVCDDCLEMASDVLAWNLEQDDCED